MYLRPFGQGPKPARAAPALHRHASPARICRRRSTACMSVAPRKRSAPGRLPPPPPGPRRSALASRRARRQASAAPQVRAHRPQSSRPATAGLPAAHHRRRSAVSALRSASPVRPAVRRAPGARLVHAPVSPPGARHVTRPAIAGRRTAHQHVSQPHRFAVGLVVVGARLPLRSSHAPPRPPPAHSARCPGGRAQPRLVCGCRGHGCSRCSSAAASVGSGAIGGDVVGLGVSGGGACCTAGKPWALPTPAPVAGGSGAGGQRPPPALRPSVFVWRGVKGSRLRRPAPPALDAKPVSRRQGGSSRFGLSICAPRVSRLGRFLKVQGRSSRPSS